ncbi:hypothetical protein BN844_0387 [Pseudomonas sp. SHC52]|nr:hypothetical protein BN844_0387 [Pseudomonas sp. SHC52]
MDHGSGDPIHLNPSAGEWFQAYNGYGCQRDINTRSPG